MPAILMNLGAIMLNQEFSHQIQQYIEEDTRPGLSSVCPGKAKVIEHQKCVDGDTRVAQAAKQLLCFHLRSGWEARDSTREREIRLLR